MKHSILILTALFGFSILNYAQGDTVQILPSYPTTNDSIKVVIEMCYYDTTLFSVENDTILFILTTDSRIDGVCAPYFDTTTIGKLAPGSWTLLYFYVDRAIGTEDSILYSKTINFEISVINGIRYYSANKLWKIYPNPANDYLVVEFTMPDFSPEEKLLFMIKDFYGRTIFKKQIQDSIERIPISNLASGNYLIVLTNNEKTVTLPFVKEN